MVTELVTPAELPQILSTISEIMQGISAVRNSIQNSSENPDLQLLFLLNAVCWMALIIERYQVLDRNERELASEVFRMTVDAIRLGEGVMHGEQGERFGVAADEVFDWFEHLLNRVNPKLGAMFYEIKWTT